MKIFIKKCQTCGNGFPLRPRADKKVARKFCSRKCMGVWRSGHQIGKDNPSWKPPVIKKCAVCGKDFSPTRWELKKGRGRFCSTQCMGAWRSKVFTGEKNHNWRGGLENRATTPIDTVCIFCGVKFGTTKYRKARGWGVFCSRECHHGFMSKTRMGENSPAWKGGISPVLVRVRSSRKGEDWRHQVFIRDHFACKRCGNIGGKLCAHHVKRFSEIIEDMRHNLPLLEIYEAAMIYDPLWDISNGITLCEPCHKKEHKKAVI